MEALDRLFRADRRTAPRALADIFETIGDYDEREDVYRAQFSDVFSLLCVTKPYSLNYLQQIWHEVTGIPGSIPTKAVLVNGTSMTAGPSREASRLWLVGPLRQSPH